MATLIPASSENSQNGQQDAAFSIEEFLWSEQEKDLLRLSTAGSVDDGKSTLIGRLLYDSRNVYEDHVRAVTRTTGGSAQASIDFAQLTDGLRAEREQGITIDVAYRYFSTERRKFIIADTPGHEQYTRNMATGASTADVAIILLDASKGILTQSRRHVYITSLLGIRHLVAAINKMDLVDFSPEVFARIEEQFTALVAQLGDANVKVIPMSALAGDNVVERSTRMPWYSGPTLLEHLESVPARHQLDGTSFRLPVQRVIRPGQDFAQQNFRGFAGQIAAGTVHVGDRVVALPSGRQTLVASISTFDGDLEQASSPQSIAITLEDEFDISRGDFLASADDPPQSSNALEASLVWFDGKPLDSRRNYLLKHAAQTVGARVLAVHHRVNVQTLAEEQADRLAMNEIGRVAIETLRPVFFDPYLKNRTTGSFILIDADTNATAAAGMIRGASAVERRGAWSELEETAFGHKPAVLLAGTALASSLEEALLGEGCAVVRTRSRDPKLWRALESVGVIALVEMPEEEPAAGARLAHFSAGTDREPELLLSRSFEDAEPAASAAEVLEALRRKGVLAEKGNG
ncbi:MAG TPA: sulfate adenylyltransferase subunit CysN [Acidobacteriaceae bacterium]|nr:sulfate adenylyltransferase subunit CysN [Acidobacteriaceae bacterium]